MGFGGNCWIFSTFLSTFFFKLKTLLAADGWVLAEIVEYSAAGRCRRSTKPPDTIALQSVTKPLAQIWQFSFGVTKIIRQNGTFFKLWCFLQPISYFTLHYTHVLKDTLIKGCPVKNIFCFWVKFCLNPRDGKLGKSLQILMQFKTESAAGADGGDIIATNTISLQYLKTRSVGAPTCRWGPFGPWLCPSRPPAA